MEFHNLSHVNLTNMQSRTLDLGVKFWLTLRSPTGRVFVCQVQDFCRSVHLHYKYANQPDDPDFNPKLYVKSGWNPPWKDSNLEDSLCNTLQDLLENFNTEEQTTLEKQSVLWRTERITGDQGKPYGSRSRYRNIYKPWTSPHLYRMGRKRNSQALKWH